MDAYRLRGKDVPLVIARTPQPLEALYPPSAGILKTDPVPLQAPPALARRSLPWDDLLSPKHFRNLNIAYVSGAEQMMVEGVDEVKRAFASLEAEPDTTAIPKLRAALEKPYPIGHALAAEALAKRGDRVAVPLLLDKLGAALKKNDFVSYWAYAEALATLGAKDAIPVLAKNAVPANPAGAFGPPGMAVGYVSACTLARLAANPEHPDVKRLLKSDNIWLRAGALRGLAEAKAPGVTELLREALEDDAALVRQEARVALGSAMANSASRR